MIPLTKSVLSVKWPINDSYYNQETLAINDEASAKLADIDI